MGHLRLVNNRRPFGLGFWVFCCFTIYQIPSTGVPLYDYQVVVKTEEGEVSFGAGDLVTFPKGLDCTWRVKKAVRKHYFFG